MSTFLQLSCTFLNPMAKVKSSILAARAAPPASTGTTRSRVAAASQPTHSTCSSTAAKPSMSKAGKGHKAAALPAKPTSKPQTLEDPTRKSCMPKDPSHQSPMPEDPTCMSHTPEDPPHQSSEPQELPHQSPAHEEQVPKPLTLVTHPAKSPLPRLPSPLSFPPPAKLPVCQDPPPPPPPLPPPSKVTRAWETAPKVALSCTQEPTPKVTSTPGVAPTPKVAPTPEVAPAPEVTPTPEFASTPKSSASQKSPPHPKSPLARICPHPKLPTHHAPISTLPLPGMAEADASTCCECHPDVLQQPTRKDKRKGKAGTAVANMLTLKKKEKKDVLAALQTEVGKWHAEVEKKVEEFAARHRLLEDEVRDIMLFSSWLKPSRGYHEFNAKVWQHTVELNE
ncbi:hypothetical protein B0H13DRAFT_1936693, partial [Mycena leptocephala]